MMQIGSLQFSIVKYLTEHIQNLAEAWLQDTLVQKFHVIVFCPFCLKVFA